MAKPDTLLHALQGIDFPVTQDGIISHARDRGTEAIEWGGKTLELKVIFNRFPETVFTSMADVENAVAAAEADTGIASEAIMRRGPHKHPTPGESKPHMGD